MLMMQLLDAAMPRCQDAKMPLTGVQFMKARTEILTNAVGRELELEPEPQPESESEMRKFKCVGRGHFLVAGSIWLSWPRVMLIVDTSIWITTYTCLPRMRGSNLRLVGWKSQLSFFIMI